jgi:hypothetical protein
LAFPQGAALPNRDQRREASVPRFPPWANDHIWLSTVAEQND